MRRAGVAFRRGQGLAGVIALTLLAAPALAQQDPRPRPFMLLNQGPATILAVELSAAGQQRYGASLIGRVELPPGNALHITPPSGSGCLSDLRIRWSNGRSQDLPGEDLCQAQRVLRLASPSP